MQLDVRTTLMIAAALALLVGLSLRYVQRDYPAALAPSIRQWMFGTLTLPIAWVLYGLRGEVSDLLAIVVANTVLTFALAHHVQALRRFCGYPHQRTLVYVPVTAMALCESFFVYVAPLPRVRGFIAAAILLAQMLLALAALADWSRLRQRSYRLTAAAFALCVLVLAARILGVAFVPETDVSAAAGPIQTLMLGVAVFLPTVASFGFVLMCSDRLQRELEYRATIDSLTGISNRSTLGRLATKAIALAQRHGRPLALLMFDIDHFKQVNDAHGHEAGDEALRLFAATVQGELRGEDLFGRLGGEEFVAVLPESDLAAALASAERLRLEVERIVLASEGVAIPLRVSVGVAALRAGEDFVALLRRADLAMYAAKRAGRNCVHGPIDEPVEANVARPRGSESAIIW